MFLRERSSVERQPRIRGFQPAAQPASNVPESYRVKTLTAGSQALGALAIGALACDALAIGALAIGRLSIGRSRVRRLEIDELIVHKLLVTDSLEQPATPRAKA